MLLSPLPLDKGLRGRACSCNSTQIQERLGIFHFLTFYFYLLIYLIFVPFYSLLIVLMLFYFRLSFFQFLVYHSFSFFTFSSYCYWRYLVKFEQIILMIKEIYFAKHILGQMELAIFVLIVSYFEQTFFSWNGSFLLSQVTLILLRFICSNWWRLLVYKITQIFWSH